MKEKVKVRGKFRLYLQWPLYLSALFIIMGLFVGLVSVKAGIIVSSFTVVYVGIALWIYFSRKRGIAAAMVEFAAAYNQMQLQVMNEMLVAYAVADENGRLLWMNREFVRIMGGEKSAPKNLLTLFPEIKREQLATGGDVVTLHSSYGDRNYRIDLHQVSVTRTGEARKRFRPSLIRK